MDNTLNDPTLIDTACFSTSILDDQSLDAIYSGLQQQQMLSSVWSTATMQISPFSKVAALHSNMVSSLSEESINKLLHDFGCIIGASALLVRDAVDSNRFFMGSIQDFNTEDKSLVLVPGSAYFVLVTSNSITASHCVIGPDMTVLDDDLFGTSQNKEDEVQPKIPRPPNAYILYRKDRHQAVKTDFPNISNTEISKILGKRWREESASIREFYKEQAEAYKKTFMEMYPDYRYKPRKASEKNRRRRNIIPVKLGNESRPSSTVIASSPETIYLDEFTQLPI
nr:putative mating-type 1-2-1 protein [Davidsoniella virescens]